MFREMQTMCDSQSSSNISGVDTDAFIRCYEAVHLVCTHALPCVQHVIQDWHSQIKQTLGPCVNSQQCLSKGKPQLPSRKRPHTTIPAALGKPPSCTNCIVWAQALESVEYTNPSQGIETSLAWDNINPTLLYHDPIEVTKAFMRRLPEGEPKTLDEIDTASLLMIMMKFEEFHQGDQNSYLAIKKVSDIRNSLSHMKMMDNLHLIQQTLESNFADLYSLVDCLRRLHPIYFTPTPMNDLKFKLANILTSPITAKMRDEALQPLTDAMKDVVYQTLEEQFQAHTRKISDIVRAVNQEHPEDLCQSVQLQIQHSFQKQSKDAAQAIEHLSEAWQSSNVMPPTYRAVDIRGNQNNVTGKQSTTEGGQTNIDTLHGSFTFNPTYNQPTIENSEHQLSNVMLPAHTECEQLDIRGNQNNVTGVQTNIEGGQTNIGTIHGSFNFNPTYNLHKVQEAEPSPFDVEACRRDLALYYLREKKTMPLLPDIPEKCQDIHEGLVECTLVRQDTKETLTSYEDLVEMKDKDGLKYNRVMVYGQAGAGKTTVISKLAYQWALESTKDQYMMIEGSRYQPTKKLQQCDLKLYNKDKESTIDDFVDHYRDRAHEWLETTLESNLSKLTSCYCSCSDVANEKPNTSISNLSLVFALNMRQLTPSTNLLDAIQDQLLSKVNKQCLESYIMANARNIIILLDGYDELPSKYATYKNDINQLLCNQWLQDARVIVTTRSNKISDFRDRYKSHVHVELQGLTQNGIITYVEKFYEIPVHHLALLNALEDNVFIPPINEDSHYHIPFSLITNINTSNHLQDLAKLPAMLAMFCILQREHEKLPDSLSILYQEILKCLAKYRWLDIEETDINDKIQSILYTLGKVALQDLFHDQLLVFQAEVFDSEILKNACQIGIMIQTRTNVGLQKKNEAVFIHKTFQELCAATYLVRLLLTAKDQFLSWLQMIDKDNIDNMKYLLKFCCGLQLNAGTHILHHIINIHKDIGLAEFVDYGSNHGHLHLPFLLLHDVYSIQQVLTKELCKLVAQIFLLCHTVKVSFCNSDVISAFGVFLTHMIEFHLEHMLASIQRVELQYIDNDSMYITKLIVQAMPGIIGLKIDDIDPHLSLSNAQDMGTYIGELGSLTHLEIKQCYLFSSDEMYDLSDSMIESLVENDNFSKNIITFKCVTEYFTVESCLTHYLSQQLNLNSLHLGLTDDTNMTGGYLPDTETAALLLSVKSAPLQNLTLCRCTIGFESIQILSPMAATLHQLILNSNTMQPNHCVQLFHCLGKAQKLNKLEINDNAVSHAISVLVDAFQFMKHLRSLHLRQAHLAESDVSVLLQGFTHLSNLQDLSLAQNDISRSSLMDIAINLHKVSLLTTLDLSECELADCREAIEILLGNLHHVSQLCKLDLSENWTPISPRGIEGLFRKLSHHSHLQDVRLMWSYVQFPTGCVCSDVLGECFQQLARKYSTKHTYKRGSCIVSYWVLHECVDNNQTNIADMSNLDSKDIEHIKEIVKKYDNSH